MNVFTFIVPGEPVAQGRPRFCRAKGGVGHVRTIDPNAADKKRFAWAVKGQFKGDPLDCPLSVEVVAHFPVPASTSKKKAALMLGGQIMHTKRPDGDNIVKLVLDAMTGVVWKDDALISDMAVRKRFAEKPFVEVIVTAQSEVAKCN